MATHVCANCGELYDAKRPVCPHCGADRDLTYAETPSETLESDWAEMDDAGYQAYLEKEGLAPRRHRVSRKPLWWGLLAMAVIAGLFLLLL